MDFERTSKTLLHILQNNADDESWNRFHTEYYPFIYSLISKYSISPEDCEELGQDVLLKVWKALPDFLYQRERCRFRTWLGTIARNTAINFLHSAHSKRMSQTVDDGQSFIDQMHTDNKLSKQEESEWNIFLTRKAWENIQSSFTSKHLKIYSLMLKGSSALEASEEYGLKEDTAYKYRTKVREAMKNEIRRLRIELDG